MFLIAGNFISKRYLNVSTRIKPFEHCTLLQNNNLKTNRDDNCKLGDMEVHAGAESGSRMITPWRNLGEWQNKYTKVCVCASASLFTKVV